jgi:hypothetical protein
MDSQQAYQTCLERLFWAFKQLEVDIDSNHLSEIAELIVQPMTGPWRFFHTPQHIFEVGGNEDAIEVIAALFHDIVYVQVDRSVNFNVSAYITPFVKEIWGELVIREQHNLPVDASFEMVCSVFGFVPAQVLNPFAGQNEFLSALVAVKALEPFLPLPQLMQIAACIEATIPFRKISADGLTVSEVLYQKLVLTNRQFNLGLTDEELEETVKKGVRVCNRDVISFAHPSSAHYLANTWNLLPETNHTLSSSGSYTVSDYRRALQKMERFMSTLSSEVIFRQFRGEPDNHVYQMWQNRANRNVEVGRLYLGSKLVAISLVEALSLGIGMDIPLATMMGLLPEQSFSSARLEDFLPEVSQPHEPKNDLEWKVLHLLEKGRAKSSASDLDNSPLATFIVKFVGFDEICYQYEQAKKFLQGDMSSEDFISAFNPTVTVHLIDAIAKLFDSRKLAVSRYYKLTFHAKPKHHPNS